MRNDRPVEQSRDDVQEDWDVMIYVTLYSFFAKEDESFLDLPGIGLGQLDRLDRLRRLFDDFGCFCGCPLFAEWSA